MSTEGGTRAIVAALLANLGIAATKFLAFALTSSSSMLAESIHSLADSGNQGLLLLGGRRSRREADTEHPFGYGRERYIYAFIVAVVLFSVGGLFALYEGFHKVSHPEPIDSWQWVPVVVLLVAIGLETFSFRTAIKESNHVRSKETSWVEFIRRAKAPELPVVLLEDFAALIGLFLALGGVTLAVVTDDPVWDAIGTLGIGALLLMVAAVLAVEMKSLLIGEGASRTAVDAIRSALVDGQAVTRVIHLRTLHLGPDELLVAAKIAVAPGLALPAVARAIDEAAIKAALEADDSVERLIHMRTLHLGPDELLVAAKIAVHCDDTAAEVAQAIDAAEARVRKAVPIATVIYVEPDIDTAKVGDRADLGGSDR